MSAEADASGRQLVDRRLDGQGLASAGLAILELDLASCDSPWASDHLDRNADQIGSREFRAGAIVGVVVEHILAGVLQSGVETLAGRIAGLVAGLHVDDNGVKGRDRSRPDDSVLVMRGLDDGGNKARRADAV